MCFGHSLNTLKCISNLSLFLISKENLDSYVLMKVLSNALAFNKGFIQCPSSDISSCSIEYTKMQCFYALLQKQNFMPLFRNVQTYLQSKFTSP